MYVYIFPTNKSYIFLGLCVCVYHIYSHRKKSGKINFKLTTVRTSSVVQGLRLNLPIQEAQVQSLVSELRSHMPWKEAKTQKHNKVKKNKLTVGVIFGIVCVCVEGVKE